MQCLECADCCLAGDSQQHRSNDRAPHQGVGETTCKLERVHSELRRSVGQQEERQRLQGKRELWKALATPRKPKRSRHLFEKVGKYTAIPAQSTAAGEKSRNCNLSMNSFKVCASSITRNHVRNMEWNGRQASPSPLLSARLFPAVFRQTPSPDCSHNASTGSSAQ